jgi:hypothetical protein
MVAVKVRDKYVTNTLHTQAQAHQLVLGAFTAIYEEIIPLKPHQLTAGEAGFGRGCGRCAQNSYLKTSVHVLPNIQQIQGKPSILHAKIKGSLKVS